MDVHACHSSLGKWILKPLCDLLEAFREPIVTSVFYALQEGFLIVAQRGFCRDPGCRSFVRRHACGSDRKRCPCSEQPRRATHAEEAFSSPYGERRARGCRPLRPDAAAAAPFTERRACLARWH